MTDSSGREEAVTGAHLREAQRALICMFRDKGFPATWINANVIDLLAQANVEYIEWLERHEPEQNPVGWLITCAYRRGLNLLSTERRRPGSRSIEEAFELADRSTPTPEQQALEDDRQRRLRKALEALPSKEQKLLSLVYFEGRSVREAGRRMGWRKSSADRHHQLALKRLRALVGDRALLSPASLGLAAWVLARGEGARLWAGVAGALSPVQAGTGAVGEGARALARRLAEAMRKLTPLTDPAGVAVSGGAGRVVGVCGGALMAVACGLTVAGVSLDPAGKSPNDPAAPISQSQPVPALSKPGQSPSSDPASLPSRHPAQQASAAARADRSTTPQEVPIAHKGAGQPGRTEATQPASRQEVEEEFGVEEGVSNPEPAPAPEAVAPPARVAGQTPSRASGATVESQFGL